MDFYEEHKNYSESNKICLTYISENYRKHLFIWVKKFLDKNKCLF